MADWGDSDDGDWDLQALEEAERAALAQRQQQTTAPAQTAPPASAGLVQQPSAILPHYQHQQPAPARQAQAQPAPGLPRTAADLRHCCRLFQSVRLPPPRPSQDRCPGVYGRGCGGELQLARWADGSCFWVCCKPECAYREYPPPRKLTPELSITLHRHDRILSVAPAPGAEDAVAWCGGVPTVLCVAGVDLRRALSVPPAALEPAPAAAAHAAVSGGSLQHAAAAAGTASVTHTSAHQPAATTTAAVSGAAALPAAQSASVSGAAGQAAGREGAEGQPAGSSRTASAIAGERPEPTAQQQGGLAAEPPAPSAQAGAQAEQPAPVLPVVFPLHEYERLSNQLLQFGRQSGVCVLSSAGTIPQATLRSARGAMRMLPAAEEVQQLYARMPAFLEAALLPFQREGVLFGLGRNGRCLIADEMGVGKTVQAIALASCYQEEWPLLIVVPASLRLVWAEELEKWLPHLRPSCIHVIEGKEGRVAQGSVPLVTITSYEMMQRLTCDACKGRGGQHVSMCAGQRPPCRDPHNCMAALRWQVVIVDESHTLRTSSKPPDALHTEAVVSAVKLARRAIMLTGTPSLSRPFDLFRQVDALVPGLLGRSRIEFSAAYCNRREVPLPGPHVPGERCTRMDVSGLSRGAELHDMLKAEVMLRRLKRDVLSQLPPKRRQVIRLPKPAASEWPKLAPARQQHADDSEGSASSGDEDEGDEEGEDDGDEEGAGSKKGRAKPMSAAHRTGLAKASSVIDWLMTALGVRTGRRASSGGAGTSAGGRRVAQQGGGPGLQPAGEAEDADADCDDGGAPGAPDAPKFLVFAHHKTVMNRLAAALEGATGYAPVGYVRIDGGTDPEDRRIAVRRFRSDASVRAALLSVSAAGVGLDFSAASVVVFAELPDEVALVRQAEDRAHRQGQSQPVNVYFLCAKGTTDDKRWQYLNRSLARVAAVHDGAGLAPAGGAAWAPGEVEQSGVGAAEARQLSAARQQGMAADAQAGLLVECVHDAEAAGLTPAAAKAGTAAGQQGGTQTGESPLPAAVAAAAGLAAGSPPAAAVTEGSPASAGKSAAHLGAGTPATASQVDASQSAVDVGAASSCVPATQESPAAGGAGAVLGSSQPCQAGSATCAAVSADLPSLHAAGAAAPAGAGSPPATTGRRLPTRGRRQPAPLCAAGTGAGGCAAAAAAAPHTAGARRTVVPVEKHGPRQIAAKRPAAPEVPSEPVEVWFEVSGNTNRLHLHGSADGSAPLRLSLPMEALLAGDSPPLEALLEAVKAEHGQSMDCDRPLPAAADAQQGQQQQGAGPNTAAPALLHQDDQQQQQEPGSGSAAPALLRGPATQQQQQLQQQESATTAMAAPAVHAGPAGLEAGGVPIAAQRGHEQQQQQGEQIAEPRHQRVAVVAGIGVLALDRHISAAKLSAMLAEAREFAGEWRELRGLHQSRLQGRVLRAPLQEAVDEVDQAAAAAGKLGTSTSRFVDSQRSDLALPAAAEWRTVRVLFKKYAKECQYQQPFMPDGCRLCINCAKPVPGKAAAKPAEAMLDGMTHLFCSGDCEGRFALKSNGSAYRRALFKLERGVCVSCRLDCHTLVKRLQAVEKGSRDWEEQRRRIVAAHAPRFMSRGYKAHLDVLVRRAVEGNAWQADHILPVYKGGGLCDVDNLRTLCVACHADVTREQAKERAAARQEEKAARGGAAGGSGGAAAAAGGGWEDVEREAAGAQGGAGSGAQPLVKRRKKLQKMFCDTDEDAEDQPAGPAVAPKAAEAGAGGEAAGTSAAAAAAAAAASTGQQAEGEAAAGATAEAAAKPAAGPSKPGLRARPRVRNRLKPLLVDLESTDTEVWDAAAPTCTLSDKEPLAAAAAAAGGGGSEQPAAGTAAAGSGGPAGAQEAGAASAAGGGSKQAAPAAAAAKPGGKQTARAAAAAAGTLAGASKPAQRGRLKRLKPVIIESESEGAESPAGPPRGSAGAEAPRPRRHRLARSSTAGEQPLPAAATAAAAAASGPEPLSAAAANIRAASRRGAAANKRPLADAAAEEDAPDGGRAGGSRKPRLARRACGGSKVMIEDEEES